MRICRKLVPLVLAVCCFAPGGGFAQKMAGVDGIVKDESGAPLAGANVFLREILRGNSTNADGYFVIADVPEGEYTLVIRFIGYQGVDIRVKLDAERRSTVAVTLEATSVEGDEIVISALKQKQEQRVEASVLDFRPVQVKRLAGGLEDVFRSLATLPGVVSTGDFSSEIVIRGGNPDQNLVLIDGIEMFNPYRLFGVTSAFNPQTVSNFELSQGGFPAKYGDRLSGVLSVDNRNGSQEKIFATNLNASLTDANLIFEGRLPSQVDGSWLLTTRRTYYDLVANQFIDGAAALPFFFDVQTRVTAVPWERHSFSVFGLTSQEGVDITSPERGKDDSIRVFNSTRNHVAGLTWNYALSPRWLVTTLVSYYDNPAVSDFGGTGTFGSTTSIDTIRSFRVNLDQQVSSWSVKQDWRGRVTANHTMEFGVQFQRLTSDLRWRVRRDFAPRSGNDLRGGASLPEFFDSPNKQTSRIGLYLQDQWQLNSRWTVQGGLRYDHTEINGRSTWSPRLNAAFRLDDRTRLKAAWGVYYQSPGYEKLVNQNFFVDYSSQLDIRSEKAVHYILGFERYLSRRVSVRSEIYYKQLSDLIVAREIVDTQTETPIVFRDVMGNTVSRADSLAVLASLDRRRISTIPTNDGRGRAYGWELLLQKDAIRKQDRFSGWLSYAYSIADRKAYGTRSPFDYDQRHTLNLVGNYRLASWLEIGAKFKLGSGFPVTEPVGLRPAQFVIDSKDANGFGDGVPDSLIILYDGDGRLVQNIDFGGESNRNRGRYPVYHRLDVRASFFAKFWGADWTFYLDVINVYNQGNVFRYEYQFAREKRDPLTGRRDVRFDDSGNPVVKREKILEFPILPTIGLSMTF